MTTTPPSPLDPLAMLSFKAMPYGGSYGAYSLTLIAVLASAGLMAWRERRWTPVLAAVLGVLLAHGVQLTYAIPRGLGWVALRFSVPLILGAAIGVLAIPATFGEGRFPRAALAFLLVPLLAFGPQAPARWQRMADGASMLAFSWLVDKPDYRDFSTQMVSPEATAHLRAIQAKIPAGEPVLAWVTTPFQLDFARNPIADVDSAGLGTPWARLPAARWVLWEVRGYATSGHDNYRNDAQSPNEYVARQGRREMALATRLEIAANHSRIVYFDRQFVVFELPEPLDGG